MHDLLSDVVDRLQYRRPIKEEKRWPSIQINFKLVQSSDTERGLFGNWLVVSAFGH